MTTRRELILLTVQDLVTDFVSYDRKEDEELPRDQLEDAVRTGEVTVEEIVNEFRSSLIRGLGR